MMKNKRLEPRMTQMARIIFQKNTLLNRDRHIVERPPQNRSSRQFFSRDPFGSCGRLLISDSEEKKREVRMQSAECRSQNEKQMIKAAGPGALLIQSLQNIRHCKWIPAFAGMKRLGGAAYATEETESYLNGFLENQKKNPRNLRHPRLWFCALCFCIFLNILSFDIRNSLVRLFDILLSPCSLCLCVVCLLSFVFSPKPNAECLKGLLSMEKPNPFQHTLTRVFYINHKYSRSGRRGRMSRTMRDNMASREDRSGIRSSKGSDVWILLPMVGTAHFLELFGSTHFDPFNNKRSPESFAEDFRLPLSSPGVCSTNPPAKPTGKFTRPNRQWCGAPRGGGEGNPRACVSVEQHEQTCCNLSAVFAPVADRQQRDCSSKHRRAASSMARTRATRLRGMLEMRKRYDFHIREDQQNMGTGNAFFQRCLYPFLRSRTFFNRPITPLCKTVRAGGVKGMIRLLIMRQIPSHCRAAIPIATVYHNEKPDTL